MKDGDMICDVGTSMMGDEAKNSANAMKNCLGGKNCFNEFQKDAKGKMDLAKSAMDMMKKQ